MNVSLSRRAFSAAALPFALSAGKAQGQQAALGPVKLGLILDMSGVYADITGAGSETAARMAIEDFGGRVLDRPIELLVADHLNKSDLAAGIASRWFDSEGVTALLDCASSGPTLAVLGIAKARNRIMMISAAGATSITNEACMPSVVHWAYNTYALAQTTGRAVLEGGGKTWFFITADYAFGHQLEGDTSGVVKAGGGQVLGRTLVPLGTTDYSSYLLSAQPSGAQVIGFAVAGADLINAVKQATEFGMGRGGQRLVALLAYDSDIHSLGTQVTQGMMLSSAYYWDRNEPSRQFARRFFERRRKMPNMSQAGAYSAMTHYLKAVQAAGTTDTAPVMQAMRNMPISDFFATNGRIRADGLMIHDMYLFQVKSPAESKGEWDLYKQVATVPGDQAFLPLANSKCHLAQRG